MATFSPNLNDLSKTEKIYVDFNGIDVFSPSWGDEFLSPLRQKYGANLFLKNIDNPSVKATIEILEETNQIKFQIKK